MNIYIHDIVTAVPPFAYDQNGFVRDFMKEHVPGDRMTKAILHKIYSSSGIGTRHSVIPDFSPDEPSGLYFDKTTNEVRSPGTGARNDLYKAWASALYVKVASELLANTGTAPEEITHVITVSCTGFYAPGPDYDIVRQCGLKDSTRRYHIGFMGCYAAFPALKLAQTICQAEPNAVILVVTTELCTLHLNFSGDTDAMLSASVFADGSAGALVSTREPKGRAMRLDQFQTRLTPQGEEDMAWTIGDHGFDMVLSSYVPDILQANLPDVLSDLPDDVRHWAIHPGGRAILDKVEQGLSLPADSLAASRKVLHENGNMSSATILFVLKELMNAEPGRILGMAFGPGLTVETAILESV
jgi:predicted naringenin-chalcone synthase